MSFARDIIKLRRELEERGYDRGNTENSSPQSACGDFERSVNRSLDERYPEWLRTGSPGILVEPKDPEEFSTQQANMPDCSL